MGVDFEFDARKVAPNEGFGLIPAGEYQAQIVSTEMVKNNSGKGEHLKIKVKILGPEYKGRVLFDRLNLINSNKEAVQIAEAQLSAICHALEIKRIKNTQQLHNKPLLISVVVEPGSNGYKDQNKIQIYSKFEEDDSEDTSWDEDESIEDTEEENEESEPWDDAEEDDTEEESEPWDDAEEDAEEEDDEEESFPWEDDEEEEKPVKKKTKTKNTKKTTKKATKKGRKARK
jgi:hypothetical protein